MSRAAGGGPTGRSPSTEAPPARAAHLLQVGHAVLVGALQEVVPVIQAANEHREELSGSFPRLGGARRSPGDEGSG